MLVYSTMIYTRFIIPFLGIISILGLNACKDEAVPMRYSCAGSNCIEDINGSYTTIEACLAACQQPANNLTPITLSLPIFSMITDVSVSNRIYFTDSSTASKFVIKNAGVIVKDTFYASATPTVLRSFSIPQLYDLSEHENDNFGRQLAISIEGFSSSGAPISKTTVDYILTLVPTKVNIIFDGTAYHWENFALQEKQIPDLKYFYINIPSFTLLQNWDTECGSFDPNANLKANIHLETYNGPFSSGVIYQSANVTPSSGQCAGSVMLCCPSQQFINGEYYTVNFTGNIGNATGNVKQISGSITQAYPNDGQFVTEHIVIK